MTYLDEVGQQIKAARKQLGLRQIDVAREARVSRATLEALENGRAADIRWLKLIRILMAVGLDVTVQPAVRVRLQFDQLLAEEEAEDK